MLRHIDVVAATVLLTGCSGAQSALAPAGRSAEDLADLFWWMTAGTVVVWIGVAALTIYAIRVQPDEGKRRRAALIIGGGAIVPTIVLTLLLIYGFRLMPRMLDPVPAGTLRIMVSGEQWWWRIRYHPPDAEPIELANEIRLPVGEPVELLLDSPDVIHSFWIPPLGGKMDMIPGRRTRLVLHPTRTGRFRGACAEYCGTAHALMAFPVLVTNKTEFTRWLGRQRGRATEPAHADAARGRAIFFATGCDACHTIRGTRARGVIGPDLTHAGSRLSIGAGILPNHHGAFLRWIERTDHVKPGVHMPAFGMLPAHELRALAAYLESLQ